MEKIDLPFFYQLGSQLSSLAAMNVSITPAVDLIIKFTQVQGTVERLFSTFTALQVCKSSGQGLLNGIKAIFATSREGTLKIQDWSKPVPLSEGFRFQDIVAKAKQFETVLTAEMENLATYHVTQKGIYSTPDLIAHAENTFPESLRCKLSAEVVHEVQESGKCLAFDIPTAAGFHILRATEAVMHDYYLAVCKLATSAKLESWGAYIVALRKSSDPEALKMAELLQQIKDQDRNVIMHPEIVLTPDDAFVLFELAQGAIMSMAERL